MYGRRSDNVDNWRLKNWEVKKSQNRKSDVETLNLCFWVSKRDKTKLKNLKRLYLRHNQIESLSEVKKLKKLGCWRALVLSATGL